MAQHMTKQLRGGRIGSAIFGTMILACAVALPGVACGEDAPVVNNGAPAAVPQGAVSVPGPMGPAVQAAANAGANSGDNYSGDFPHREVMAVPPARANATAARWLNYQAQDNLHYVVDRLNEDYQSSNDMVEALRQEKSAYADFEDARHRVLTKLNSDPSYRAMTRLVAQLKDDLENHQPKGTPSEEESQHIMAVAALKLSYASSVTAMEATALAADAPMQQAKGRLVAAGQRLADLRAKGAHDLKRDEQFVAAHRAMEDARISHLAAQAYYESSVEAADIAMNYAYYIHGWDFMRYAAGNGYGYSGYPYYPYGNYYGGYAGTGPLYGVTIAGSGGSYPVIRR